MQMEKIKEIRVDKFSILNLRLEELVHELKEKRQVEISRHLCGQISQFI